MGHVQPPASGGSERDVAGDHCVFRCWRYAGQAQASGNSSLGHDAVGAEVDVLAVVAYGAAQVGAVGQSHAHQVGVLDRVSVVAEGDGPRSGQLLKVGQFAPLSLTAHASNGQDADHSGLPGAPKDELDQGLGINRRIGVGHAANGGESTAGCGQRTGGDGLLVFVAGFTQVNMQIDETRAGNQPCGVHGDASVRNTLDAVSGGENPAV